MNTLKAEKRSMDVKAKKLRREGYVTGNLFGREIEGSLPIQMTKKAVDQLLKTDNKGREQKERRKSSKAPEASQFQRNKVIIHDE